MSEQPRRIPGLGIVLSLAFLILPIAGVAWWLNRPRGEITVPGPPLAELDVVCLGRIDGLKPVTPLEPTMAGKIVEVYAREGQHVEAGAKLLRLEDEAARLHVAEAQDAIAAADVDVEAANLEAKVFPLRKASQEMAIAIAESRVAAARQLLEERKPRLAVGTVSAAELNASELEVRQLEDAVKIEKNRLDQLELSNPDLRIRAAVVKRKSAETGLKQAEKAVRDCVLTAPASGTVLRVAASVGEATAPGTPQAPIVFRPDGPLVVRAELEQEFLGRVKPGMKATIRDDARPDYPPVAGTVLQVGQLVAKKRSMLLEPGELNDVRTVECVIGLDQNPDGLLVGQRMRVRIGPGK